MRRPRPFRPALAAGFAAAALAAAVLCPSTALAAEGEFGQDVLRFIDLWLWPMLLPLDRGVWLQWILFAIGIAGIAGRHGGEKAGGPGARRWAIGLAGGWVCTLPIQLNWGNSVLYWIGWSVLPILVWRRKDWLQRGWELVREKRWARLWKHWQESHPEFPGEAPGDGKSKGQASGTGKEKKVSEAAAKATGKAGGKETKGKPIASKTPAAPAAPAAESRAARKRRYHSY